MAPAVEKDSEIKRRRNALSCAECRRLKLKCDRAFPCASCRKRGCAAICPDGALTTGKLGGRFILANTEQLHEKIADLQLRIADLEEALAASHAAQASNTHPLLRPELLALKTPLGAELIGRAQQPSRQENAASDGPEEVLESFGTLTIGEGGVSTFYGSTVGSEFLFEEEDDEGSPALASPVTSRQAAAEWLPSTLSHLAHAFPFATLNTDVEAVKDDLKAYLPPANVAWHLAQCYFSNAAWMYNPLHKQAFLDDLLNPLYDTSHTKPITSHGLSVVFSVFALGVLVDLDRQPYDQEGEKYHLLARAALAVESCLETTTINAVQALILMAYFNQMTDKKNGPALTWSMNGLAMKLAQSIGLHRDWEKWGLPIGEVAIRRTVMWECITFDSWSAFGFGRPPSQAMHFVDCKQTPDPQIFDDPCASFDGPKYAFTELLLEVVNACFGATPPTYEDIMKLDRRLRDYYIPPLFQVAGVNADGKPRPQLPENPPLALALQSHALAMLRENALLYMHRSFFAKALSEHPDDPFKSRYATSVLACHRSACAIIVLVRKLHHVEPRLILRFWYFWVHSFTAAVVLASIVTKTPRSNLAPSSMLHVDLACDLFQQVASGSRPSGTLPILMKIRQKAYAIQQEYTNAPVLAANGKAPSPPREVGDGLDPMLSGQTRLVSKKKKSPRDVPIPESDIPDQQPLWYPETFGELHPSLMEHLRSVHALHPNTAPMGGPSTSQVARPSNASYTPSPPANGASVTSTPFHLQPHPLPGTPGEHSLQSWDQLPPQVPSQSSLLDAASYRLSQPSGSQYVPQNDPARFPPQQWNGQSTPQTLSTTHQMAPYQGHQYDPASPYPYSTSSASSSGFRDPPQQMSMTPAQTAPRMMQNTDPAFYQQPATPGWTQPVAAVMGHPSLHPALAAHADPVGGLMHSGGVGTLEQTWRSFLSGVDFPTSPVPGTQQM